MVSSSRFVQGIMVEERLLGNSSDVSCPTLVWDCGLGDDVSMYHKTLRRVIRPALSG